jgi:hypothetical protein
MNKIYLASLASSCLLVASMPSAAFSQEQRSISSAAVAPTCRSALDIGGTITEVSGVAAPPCCYVIQEQDWYDANNIRLSATYQREDGETYLTEPCELLSESDIGASPVEAVDVVVAPVRAGAPPAQVVSGGAAADGSQAPIGQNGASTSTGQGNPGTVNTGNDNTDTPNSPTNSGGTASNGNAFAGNGNAGQGNAFAGSGNAGRGNGGPDGIGNPGNDRDVGRAGEAPNGDTAGFKPNPGTRGQSN